MSEEDIARHCMMCQDVYYRGERMSQKEYHNRYTNKDYTTGICSRDECINKYLAQYVVDKDLVVLIRKDIAKDVKKRGW